MANLSLKNSEILRAIGMVAGLSRDPDDWSTIELDDARAIIRAGLRKFFHPMPFHQWRFLERQFIANSTDTYSTGTVAVSAGTVTLTSGTWPAWADDCILIVGGQSYWVDSRTSDSVIVLKTSNDVDSGTSYELVRWRYPMNADFGELIDGCVYSNGNESRYLQGADEAEVRLRYAVNNTVTRPERFSVFAGDDSDSADWYLGVWPKLEENTFVTVTYRAVPDDLLDDADLTADGSVVQVDAVHAETLLAAIMAATEEYYNDTTKGPHNQRFTERIRASIAHDLHSRGPIIPKPPQGVDPKRYAMFANVPIYYDGDGTPV